MIWDFKKMFFDMLDEEINECIAEAKNEHIWALGSSTNEEATEHELNAERCRAYANFLTDVKRKLEECIVR